MRPPLVLALLLAALVPLAAAAAPRPQPAATVETPALFDDDAGGNADGDDPAIWVHPRDEGRSLVIATKKDAGLSVYGLDGAEQQALAPPAAPGPEDAAGRFNNVDVLYDVRLGKERIDLALVSDRGRDQLRAYAIRSGSSRPPLVDVTAPGVPFVFNSSQDEVNEQATVYGVAAFREPDGTGYVVVSRRHRTELALLRIVRATDGVSYERVATTRLPAEFKLPNGVVWSPCEDPGEEPQVEGMVVDWERGTLFAGQEDVGIWRIPLSRRGFGEARLVDRVREYGVPAAFDEQEEECVETGPDPGFGGRHLSADVEGLTIYYAKGNRGYLLASSQGDDTFAAYGRKGDGEYLGSFEIVDGAADSVQESDGAAVLNVALGQAFPRGLLVTHDGENTPAVVDDQGEERPNTNFKLTRWEAVAASFPEPLRVDPRDWDPRRP